jgi:penicillin-binding protein 1A
VFNYGETYAAIQVMKTVVTSGTGTAANYGCPVAGKTGTAQNLSNGWFVGFSPKLSTAVWVGYPNNNNLQVGFGGTVAAPIWHDYMDVASDGFCGDWTAPTTPFSGTAFVGPHSTGPPPPPSLPSSNLPAIKPSSNKTKTNGGAPPGFGTGHTQTTGGTTTPVTTGPGHKKH